MRMSTLLAPTLRENPAEAEVVSHQLLVRAGYIRRLANGVYSYLPLMQRVLRKVEQIIREEMDRAGAQELLMPILQPAEVWQASGRWDIYGDLMMRVKDRHDRWYGLAPTAEEVITDIATREVRSYRQLPLNLYQIQIKYRDEIRPRFGLLRGREFIMKDAYSFHASQESMDQEYDNMAQAYRRIFDRCGLETRMVRSDSGTIGGSVSHEFMVLTRIAEGEQESGENDVFYCEACGYAANVERAESILPDAVTDGAEYFQNHQPNQEVETPDCDTIEKLYQFLNCPSSVICKTLLYIKDEQVPFLVLIRGDREVEETKLRNAVHAREVRLASPEEITRYFDTIKGYIGIGKVSNPGIHPCCEFRAHAIPGCDLLFPSKLYGADPLQLRSFPIPESDQVATDGLLPILVDYSIAIPQSRKILKNFVIGYEKTNFHMVRFNWPSVEFTDALLRNARDVGAVQINDTCPECRSAPLKMTRGIEVGNIFQLGTRYSASMNAIYTAEDGSSKPFIMGCYGIGVTRTAAAAIERFHDQSGIIWPMAIAPYHVVISPVNVQDETQWNLAMEVYRLLQAQNIEVVLDDRDERAGVKFKDADLIGFPIRLTVGKKAAQGLLEVKMRDQSTATDLPVDRLVDYIRAQLREWHPFSHPGQPAAV